MNIWLKYVDKVYIIAPVSKDFDSNINLAYQHNNIHLKEIPSISLLGIKEKLRNIYKLPIILTRLYQSMDNATHIHLRCPGNIGLLGCLVQILFPRKPKTAKYAGNWDPKANQPWSYNFQKWILSNTLISKNIKVLVYGKWPHQSKNIKPFFTASYFEFEKQDNYIRNYTQKLKFCFVGTLSNGKQPQIAFELIRKLRNQKVNAELSFYGDGVLKSDLENLITKHDAIDWVKIHGNQPQVVIKKALKYHHFLILPSLSEGWPKVVAEAMFWGCIPIVSSVSCTPWMLKEGERGILMTKNNLKADLQKIKSSLNKPQSLEEMSLKASEWSRKFTLDLFEEQIERIL